jgi:hypothetical protein
MRRAANRPDPDQLAAGHLGEVNAAVRQRPPCAVRTTVLYPDVQNSRFGELDGVEVQLLGPRSEAEDLPARDRGEHVLTLLAGAYLMLVTRKVSPQGLIRSVRSTPVTVTLSP